MNELIDFLLETADLAHKEHLATGSYAAHMALGGFYEGLRTDTDALAESLIALGNEVTGNGGDIVNELKARYGTLLQMRDICDGDKAVENLFDTVAANFLSAIYRLERLS
jgi:Family of unknown function (DUF5856)